MSIADLVRLGRTLGLGLAGAGAGAALGLPAGALVGAALATGAASVAGVPLDVPPWLRDAGFCVIGITLGAGIGPGFFGDLLRWGPSLALLLAAQAVTLLTGARILRRRLALSADTACLAASPGGISTAVALALEGRGDATPVLVLQVMRILSLVALTPPVALLISTPAPRAAETAMGWPMLLALFALAWPAGRLGQRARLPAATILLAMVLSGATRTAGLTAGPPPEPAIFAGFALAGCVLGTRLTGLGLSDLRRYGAATLAVLANAVAISLAFALVAARLLGLDPGATWIAFAPGGVEAMAAIGLALGHDPAFIAVHHVSRILALSIAVPILTARIRTGSAES